MNELTTIERTSGAAVLCSDLVRQLRALAKMRDAAARLISNRVGKDDANAIAEAAAAQTLRDVIEDMEEIACGYDAENNRPPCKPGWKHSEQVLVYYAANPEAGLTYKWGIAYFHYDPPFTDASWTDFDNPGRTPSRWWPLPMLPNAKLCEEGGK